MRKVKNVGMCNVIANYSLDFGAIKISLQFSFNHKITKNEQNWWNWEKNIAKLHFFEDVIFGSQKIKKSNHQKCEEFIKQCQIFIEAFERRVLNTIFGSSESSRKIFFSDHVFCHFFSVNLWLYLDDTLLTRLNS